MTWAYAGLDRYGSDKPDTRFGRELTGPDRLRSRAPSSRRSTPTRVKGICVPGGGDASRSTRDGLVERAKQLVRRGTGWMRVPTAACSSPVAKFLSETEHP